MRTSLLIIFLLMFSIVGFAQDESAAEESKVKEALHPTAIEIQAYRRIAAHFTSELLQSSDVAKALSGVSSNDWKKLWLKENLGYLPIKPESLDSVTRSGCFNEFVPELINSYFIVIQLMCLVDGDTDDDGVESEIEEIARVEPLLSRVLGADSESQLLNNDELGLYAQVLKRFNLILRSSLVNRLQKFPIVSLQKFYKNIAFPKQPEIEILEEQKYGLSKGTRVFKASTEIFTLTIARVDGVYKVVNFHIWMGD